MRNKNSKLNFIATVVCFLLGSSSLYAEDEHKTSKLPSSVKNIDFHENGNPSKRKVRLGQLLFFDKILSGNKNMSCASCHHGLTNTGDGLSLPIGEGARGLGVARDTGNREDAVVERVPRNAPPIFSLGAKEITILFHDGRVAVDEHQPSGFSTPAGNDLPLTLENVLAAQAMFPVTSATEMAGQAGENSIANAAAIGNLAGIDGVWEQLATRLKTIPEYVTLFGDVFGISAEEITYAHAANAISAFESFTWRADKSTFDRYLRGNKKAMSRSALKGMKLFYGKANCASCHSGKFQTDMKFHSIAMPQIGPGKGNGFGGYEDFGRELVTENIADRYKFRTPPLRNVALTGPWGHAGAFNSLEMVVKHHLSPETSLVNYDCESSPVLPYREDLSELDCKVMDNADVVDAILESNELENIHLNKKEMEYIIDFLHSLTDPNSLATRNDVPNTVPSGLPVAD